jgi:hypothetical protein
MSIFPSRSQFRWALCGSVHFADAGTYLYDVLRDLNRIAEGVMSKYGVSLTHLIGTAAAAARSSHSIIVRTSLTAFRPVRS